MRRFIFKSDYSLGDIVLLTAAVRDLHRCYPGQLQTDVRTGFADLWKHNPYLSRLNEYDPDVTTVRCDMPLVQRSNESACHCLHGFTEFLNQYLGTRVRLTECKGDIHLSPLERRSPSPLRKLTGNDLPFWLVSAGGKLDNTIKWWEARRYQEVVDHFRGCLQFVQVGHPQDYHPPLEGVIDLRGQTTVRTLVRLVHHAEGVLCGVTGLMHLAAAVPTPNGRPPTRPCVVVAGGREPPSWEAYPGHQFVHTVGTLPCCSKGGCWRSRTVPLYDGEANDNPESLCVDVRGGLPRCMQLITTADVIRRIEAYLEGGPTGRLRPSQIRSARGAVAAAKAVARPQEPLNACTALPASERFIASLRPCPPGFRGRGIVVCAGGVRMFTNAWVCINMLRRFGCRLPIQLWHLGRREMDAEMRALLKPLRVACVDAHKVLKGHPARRLHGWSLKPYAVLHSPFQEVLLLDADNVPVARPDYLFDTPEYRRTGAVFWPDFGRLRRNRSAWKVFGVAYRDEPEFESGQILLNKAVCWEALRLCMWYNENSDFYYRHVHGDKETFHMAFRKLARPYAMPATPIKRLRGTMCQHDFEGRRLFQHRNLAKWTLLTPNRKVRGFLYEQECRDYLAQLEQAWDARKSVFFPAAVDRSGRGRFRPQPDGEVRLAVCMVSCQARQQLRQRTLAGLAQGDWGRAPLVLVLDEGRFASRKENVAHAGWRALQQCLKAPVDYILYLEDDLGFNRHFRHNLEHWPLLQEGEIAFASLYNPTLPELAWDMTRQATLVEARGYYGTQAVLLSRPLAESFVDHWFEGPTELDLKWKNLAMRQNVPFFVHSPSLVQHCGSPSLRGSTYHWAEDYDPEWKSPNVAGGRRLRFVELPGAIQP
jgi:ADP-heptose:LPS heptosyltransferase